MSDTTPTPSPETPRFTPGPWERRTHRDSRGALICDVIGTANGAVIAYLPDSTKQHMPGVQTVNANAALMAAAPRMLEALRGLLGTVGLVCVRSTDRDGPAEYATTVEDWAVREVRAAIATAVGEG